MKTFEDYLNGSPPVWHEEPAAIQFIEKNIAVDDNLQIFTTLVNVWDQTYDKDIMVELAVFLIGNDFKSFVKYMKDNEWIQLNRYPLEFADTTQVDPAGGKKHTLYCVVDIDQISVITDIDLYKKTKGEKGVLFAEKGDLKPGASDKEIDEFVYGDIEYGDERKGAEQDTPNVETSDTTSAKEEPSEIERTLAMLEQAEDYAKQENVERFSVSAYMERRPILEDSVYTDDIELSLESFKDLVMPANSSDKETKLFYALCVFKKLNPLKQEISWRRTGVDKGVAVIHYQTHLKIAARNPMYDGYEHGVIVQKQGDTLEVEIEGQYAPKGYNLVGGWARVYRKDRRVPVTKRCQFLEYRPKYNGWERTPWGTIPGLMIAKVASSQAHREAFPEDLGALYTASEMDQAGDKV